MKEKQQKSHTCLLYINITLFGKHMSFDKGSPCLYARNNHLYNFNCVSNIVESR